MTVEQLSHMPIQVDRQDDSHSLEHIRFDNHLNDKRINIALRIALAVAYAVWLLFAGTG
jgi:hypothetical protein